MQFNIIPRHKEQYHKVSKGAGPRQDQEQTQPPYHSPHTQNGSNNNQRTNSNRISTLEQTAAAKATKSTYEYC